MKIRLQKISAVENPVCPTPDMKDFVPGVDNGPVSLPEGYTVEGTMEAEAEIGKSIIIARTHRNGVASNGLTETTPVVAIRRINQDKLQITTANSVYILEHVE